MVLNSTEHSLGYLVLVATYVAFFVPLTQAEVYHYKFFIEPTPLTRLCQPLNVIMVNGQLPGPTLYVHNGDTIIVEVCNRAKYNATIHWHGVRQIGTAWSDGPGYITQCPIQPGGSYTYRFTIIRQEGTLWWHAHVSWLRASVYGAIVIYPKRGSSYPFAPPDGEIPILLGEWWNTDPIVVVNQAKLTGGGANKSDAFTVNGQPGDLYPCSSPGTFRLPVERGRTYLLRVVNAAISNDLFFKVADHNLTVVAVDASYTKPYTTDVMFIAPGQTVDVLLTANQAPGSYYMAARPYTVMQPGNFDNTTTTAILQYMGAQGSVSPILPELPEFNDTATVFRFIRGLRSLASLEHPVNVPMDIDENIILTVGLGLLPCPAGTTCAGPNNTRIRASINNVSFVEPTVAILQAAYFGINGIFSTDFSHNPPVVFNYTGQNIPRSLWAPSSGTNVKVLNYNATVQMVFQGTNIFLAHNHPMHLHGHNFYVVGVGFGNYNPQTDPRTFNLVDPPKRNTVEVPASGWAAVRFRASNPGAWYMHCHFDDHNTWGLSTVFLVKNGHGYQATLKPPPPDLPRC